MKTENADWPISLRMNAASIELAIALYAAQIEAFGPATAPKFAELPTSQRRQYVDAAAGLLRLLRPATKQEAIRGVSPVWIARVARSGLRLVTR